MKRSYKWRFMTLLMLCIAASVSFASFASMHFFHGAYAYGADQSQNSQTGEYGAFAERIVGSPQEATDIDMSKIPSTTISVGGIPDDPVKTNTPPVSMSFQGEAYNTTICRCDAPDMALGVSPNWVFQGVNRVFAVYDVQGRLQPTWPKKFTNFFGTPNPGRCSPGGVNLFDPRAFYDPNDQRFWAESLSNVGVRDSCSPFQSRVWIAVSRTNNPNGSWNVYSFDITRGTRNFGDFSQFGYDQHAVYFSCDMLAMPASSGVFQYEQTFGFNKAAMESGRAVTPYGFSNFKSQGVQVNSIQPVEVEALNGTGPNAGLFISSFDYKSGGGKCIRGCSGLTVWAIANPGTSSERLSSFLVATSTYSAAPLAEQPGCMHCLETADTGISGTPVWRNGQITFSLQTAIKNGTQSVAGIFWGQIHVTLGGNGVITNANAYQSGYFSYSGDISAIFPTIMPNARGDLVMVFQETGSNISPSVVYAVKPAGTPLGRFPDRGNILKHGGASSPVQRWGDYTAVSTPDVTSDTIWFASEYEAANQHWSSYIGAVN